MIAGRYRERVTFGMNGPFTVARSTIRYRFGETFVNRSHRKIVIQNLRKLHGHQSVSTVEVANVWMYHSRYYSWIW